MALMSCKVFESSDVARDAWAGLTHFQNVELLADRICALHNLPKNARQHARKQAAQIRYCLLQAREYALSANAVSLATKPVLLYYAVMSFALCEILFKNDGNSRLEKLREQHNCHGLQLAMSNDIPLSMPVIDILTSLSAKPQMSDKGPKGTFEVWHRVSREEPMIGWAERILPLNGGTHRGVQVLMHGDPNSPPPLPRSGVTLFDCLQSLPRMADALSHHGIELQMVRATPTSKTFETPGEEFSKTSYILNIHPSTRALFDAFGEMIRVEPRAVPQIDATQTGDSSGRLTMRFDTSVDMSSRVYFPWSIATSPTMSWFSTRAEQLNEFGRYYVALHILGNLARYYPDKWLAHIESHTPLAAIAATLLDVAAERLPLLLLGELRQQYLIVER